MRQYRLIKDGIALPGMVGSKWYISEDKSRLVVDLNSTVAFSAPEGFTQLGAITPLVAELLPTETKDTVVVAKSVIFSIRNGRMRIFYKNQLNKIIRLNINFAYALDFLRVKYMIDVTITYSYNTDVTQVTQDAVDALNYSMSSSSQFTNVTATSAIKNKTYAGIRDHYGSFFFRLIKRFAKLNGIAVPKMEYTTKGDFQSYNYKDEELFSTLFLLCSPIMRAFHKPNLRYMQLIDSIPNNFKDGIPALGDEVWVGKHKIYYKEMLLKFLLSKDIPTFVKFITKGTYSKLTKLIAAWFDKGLFPVKQHVIPVGTVVQAGIPNIIEAIVTDYYIHAIDTTAASSITLTTQVYQAPRMSFFMVLANVLNVSDDCNYWYQILEEFVNSDEVGSAYFNSEIHNNLLMNTNTIRLLRQIGERKAVKLLKDFMMYSMLSDTSRMFYEFEDMGSLPQAVKDAFPEGIRLPEKIRNIKDLHDNVMNQHRDIKRMVMEIEHNEPFSYKRFEKLHSFLTGKKIEDSEIVLAKNGVDLVLWGDELHNCIGSYDSRARAENCFLIAIRDKEGKLTHAVEISPELSIVQCMQIYNSRDEEMKGKLSKLLFDFKKELTEPLPEPEVKPEQLEEAPAYIFDDMPMDNNG